MSGLSKLSFELGISIDQEHEGFLLVFTFFQEYPEISPTVPTTRKDFVVNKLFI